MFRSAFVITTISAYLLTGCASTGNGSSAASKSSDNPEQMCNSVVTSLLLGIGCALVSNDKNRVRNGLACAAAGYVGCMLANSYKAEQVKTAKEVEREYLLQRSKLPDRAMLASYTTNIDPSTAISKGQKVNVSSNIVVIPGRQNSNVKIEEEVALVDSVGDQWGKSVRKQANPSGEAGQYNTSFTIPIRSDMSQGVYTVHKTLFLDGIKTRQDDMGRFQIVILNTQVHMASSQ